MDNRPVVKVKTDYYWYCPECNERNEEILIPGTPDLTCQSCGANFKNGTPLRDEQRRPPSKINRTVSAPLGFGIRS